MRFLAVLLLLLTGSRLASTTMDPAPELEEQRPENEEEEGGGLTESLLNDNTSEYEYQQTVRDIPSKLSQPTITTLKSRRCFSIAHFLYLT